MNPWLILAAVLAIGGAYMYGEHTGDAQGAARIQQQWDKDAKKQSDAHAKALEELREKQQGLQKGADNEREERNKQLRDANARVAALANIVRDKSDRPTQTSSVSGTANIGPTATGCTGAGLYRSDGEFLAGEAAAARTCQVYLKECRSNYERLTR